MSLKKEKDAKTLTKAELNRIAKRLSQIENETISTTGVFRISGGFAVADMTGYDDEGVDVRLKWGVQSDCQDEVHTEHILLHRDTLQERG